MGLDEQVEAVLEDEKKRFEQLGVRRFSYDQFRYYYPDDFGKIDCRRGFLMALEQNQKPTNSLQFMVRGPPDDDDDYPALYDFKNFIHFMYQLKLTKGDPDELKSLERRCKKEATELTLAEYPHRESIYFKKYYAIKFFSENFPVLENFYSTQAMHELFDLLSNKKGKVRYSKILQFNKRQDKDIFKLAFRVLRTLEETLEPFDPDDEKKFKRPAHFLLSQIKQLDSFLQYEEKNKFAEASVRHYVVKRVVAQLNSPVGNIAVNDVDCCLTVRKNWKFNPGYNLTLGKQREASILYCLDPAVDIWTVSADCEIEGNFSRQKKIRSETFGMGIFVEAEGYHHASPQNVQKYLVLEGFPATTFYLESIDRMVHDSSGEESLPECSLSESVYFMGLLTAKRRGIGKLFVNTRHSGHQQSVEAAVIASAEQAKVPSNSIKLRKVDDILYHHETLQLVKDPATCGEFPYVAAGDQKLEYTHFLTKPSMAQELVKKVGRDPEWKGDGFFDTWYKWNKFVMETYPQWSEDLRKKHPYAESVWKRGKEPQWNLGIGYCKGFEVDVGKECARLGIK